VKRLAVFLSTGVVGVAALLSGLALDAYLHAKDPTLAHREGIFTLTNPGHVLLGAGIALVVVGLIGAAYTSLPFGFWARRAFLVSSLALIVLSGDAAGWAATQQFSTQGAGATAASHDHTTVPAVGVTGPELQAAVTLIDQTRAAVAKYKDLRAAVRAGYKPMEPPDFEIVHYVNAAYMNQADVLNPKHVQSLIYFNGKHGPVLIGAMFIMPRIGDKGPEIGGQLTQWHHHDNLCFDLKTNMVVAFARDPFTNNGQMGGSCPTGSSNRSTPEMLHVWVIDNPDGPFGADMNPVVLETLK